MSDAKGERELNGVDWVSGGYLRAVHIIAIGSYVWGFKGEKLLISNEAHAWRHYLPRLDRYIYIYLTYQDCAVIVGINNAHVHERKVIDYPIQIICLFIGSPSPPIVHNQH